ncbi:MAG: YibE/F family protein [Candidatus Paralactobacillus gallistercoris]|uniref:YibE/F family protein n=1 Tax=Candidatus Paralactobacillus gallistercoris TaxID=2838724 RepID=A0A948TJD3_9LACO|nr:YibE/F family protein [Candidatus Paralactobacillus gallistercoris]
MLKVKKPLVKLWQLLLVFISGIVCVVATHYDAFLYHQPVGEVVQVLHSKTTTVQDEYQNTDQQTKQQLRLRVLNGSYRGHYFTVSNTYTRSGALDVPYHRHQQVMMSIERVKGKPTAAISNPKRDTSVVFTLWLAITLTLLFMRFSGVMALLSIGINALLFYAAICWDLHWNGANVLMIFGSLAVLFAIMTLTLVLGFHKATIIALTATLGGTFLALLIGTGIMNITHEKNIYFEAMAYVTQLPRPLFRAEILLGSLGAVMDIIMDMVATLTQVCHEQPNLSHRQIFITARHIGQSIMGPLINVLFMIFIGSTLPMAILYLQNGNSIAYTFHFVMSLGIVQSLISGIGITLAVLLTEILASWLMGKKVNTDVNH